MKSAVLTAPDIIEVRDAPTPVPDADSILVRVEACGICGSDIRNFHSGPRLDMKEQVMGHEIAGVVEEAGAQVSRFKVNDRVAVAPDVSCGKCQYCARGWVNLCVSHRMVGTHWPGGFSTHVIIPKEVLERGMVHPMPASLSCLDATMSEPASSVLASQENAGVREGDTVLIIGDGPIGCLHIEVARARGARRIIMAGLMRLALAPQFGPDHLIDAGKQNTVEEVQRITGGFGADVAICANPVASTQEQAVESVRKRGTIVLFGGLPKTKPMTTLNSNLIHYNELRVIGAFSYPASSHVQALDWITKGHISAAKYVNMQVPLGGVVDGIKAAESGKALKVAVCPRQG